MENEITKLFVFRRPDGNEDWSEVSRDLFH